MKSGTLLLRTRIVKQRNVCIPLLHTERRTATVSANKGTYFDDAALAAAKPFEDIPHFKILPVIGTAWTFFPIIGYYDMQKQHLAIKDKCKRLGNIYRDKVGPLNFVVSCNADDGQTLFRNEGPYPNRGEIMSLKAYRESRKQWYSTGGVLLIEGKEWHDLRSKVQKHLMKPKAVQAYLSPMQDVARELVDKILKIRDANKEVPEFLGELYKWSLESIALIGLDTRLGCLDEGLTPDSDGMKMIKSVQTQSVCMNKLEGMGGSLPLWKYFPTPTWKTFVAEADTFTEIAFKHINRALEELKKEPDEDKDPTLLQSMLMTKGLDASKAMVMVTDMLMAGIDTTSHSVGFFLYHMARNPKKQELLYQEIKNLLPRKEDRITPAVFNELKYLKACMKESQRLLPVTIGTLRCLDHDAIFSGYRVPTGTFVFLGLQEISSDERYFTNANLFLPERWLNKDDKFHPFAFLPFGFGVRSCIGRRLAELEIICLVTELVRNFRVEYHYEDIDTYSRLVNTPDKPLRYSFIER